VSESAGLDDVRVGTREREDSVRILGEHFSEGRLQMDEYEHRVDGAVRALTRGELRALFTDLPPPYPPFLAPPPAPPPVPVVYVPQAPAPYQHGYSDKNRLAAGLLQILVPFGAGRFYTGHTGIAVAQLISAFFFVGIVWSFVDGVILLASGGTDVYGRRLRDG
jgi:hypothetical protein